MHNSLTNKASQKVAALAFRVRQHSVLTVQISLSLIILSTTTICRCDVKCHLAHFLGFIHSQYAVQISFCSRFTKHFPNKSLTLLSDLSELQDLLINRASVNTKSHVCTVAMFALMIGSYQIISMWGAVIGNHNIHKELLKIGHLVCVMLMSVLREDVQTDRRAARQ
jgi:hypothetical protein